MIDLIFILLTLWLGMGIGYGAAKSPSLLSERLWKHELPWFIPMAAIVSFGWYCRLKGWNP